MNPSATPFPRGDLGDCDDRSLPSLAKQAKKLFRQTFLREATWVAAAPGRVNLIGGHVDYKDGIVVPMAIDSYTVVAGVVHHASNLPQVRCFSKQVDEMVVVDLLQPFEPRDNSWANYLTGVLAGFAERGQAIPAFDAVVVSSVPTGAGLSSSAALEVALATLMESMLAIRLPKLEKAKLCRVAEHRFAATPCGLMDQFASVFAESDRLIQLDCFSGQYQLIDWPKHAPSVIVIDTGFSHRLADGQYAQRKEQCGQLLRLLQLESFRQLDQTVLDVASDSTTGVSAGNETNGRIDETLLQRGRHVIGELQRSRAFVQAVREQNWVAAGQQMWQSHDSLRDDYQVSCPQLDFLVLLSRRLGNDGGVFGMRMTGGGFGGSVVGLVMTDRINEIRDQLMTGFRREFGQSPAVLVTRPAAGALTL